MKNKKYHLSSGNDLTKEGNEKVQGWRFQGRYGKKYEKDTYWSNKYSTQKMKYVEESRQLFKISEVQCNNGLFIAFNIIEYGANRLTLFANKA